MEWGELSKPIQLQTIDRELTESLEEEKKGGTHIYSFFFSLWYQTECTMDNPNKALYLQI